MLVYVKLFLERSEVTFMQLHLIQSSRAARRFIAVFLAAGAAIALVFTLASGAAKPLARSGSLQTSSELAHILPGMEDIDLRYATMLPNQRVSYLRKALGYNPWNSGAAMELGMASEESGDPAAAERYLKHAVRTDAGSRPLWAMINFYFRENRRDDFMASIDRYRRTDGEDARSLFRLVYASDDDVASILHHFRPLSCSELRGFLSVLEDRSRLLEALPVGTELTACVDRESTAAIDDYLSSLLADDHPEAAGFLQTKVRSALAQASFESQPTQILLNEDFAQPLTQKGFDWRINLVQGVRTQQFPQGHAMQFDFDGEEPDAAVLLYQPVVLTPGMRYRITGDSESTEPAAKDAFAWRLMELTGGRVIDAALDSKAPAVQGSQIDWSFTAPPSGKTVVLAFVYARPSGKVKLLGTQTLTNVRLAPLGPPQP